MDDRDADPLTTRVDALEPAIGRAWTDDRSWTLLTRLTELPHRMGGSPGERRAADLLSEAFRNAGLEDVSISEFPMQYWERGTTEFAVLEDRSPSGGDDTLEDAEPDRIDAGCNRSFEAIALPYSPASDVTGPLVDIGYGTPEEIADVDLQGAIALSSTTTPPGKRFVHRMETFGHAVAAGAAGFVFANHVPGQLPPTGALTFDGEAAAPGIGVSAETGDWLREYAADGVRARIRVDATTQDGSSQNVAATVGPDTDTEVLVVAHYDAHDVAEGALDNGCGIATVVGAAAVLSAIEDSLAQRVRLVGVGCEEIGLLGAEALADDLDLESVSAVLNVDGAGRFRNLRALTHGSAALEELAERVTDDLGQPLAVESDPHPFSDHWPFLRAGVPAIQLHSEPPEGRERGRGWGHTAADTRDKVDPRNLREHAVLTARIACELTHASVPRVADAELREQLQAQEYESGMQAADLWPDRWADRA
ncbi:M28 family metallopeptidase [Natrarchaeobaculum sulfurireducens]|uniref:Carboxypeptidase Q n=1 Tax=Natrarchaeobaculum sulfurireducens TaxID=2044521 RepID=A0A346PLU3_9EURY|nr:M28 family metallopeptidase [Natrarchaeobaculum sulfurireducens]AXR80488.1 Aminopeptidase Y (Arg, Lys, Leu preference) [Natrarchaeobaculum sulfurireducens]